MIAQSLFCTILLWCLLWCLITPGYGRPASDEDEQNDVDVDEYAGEVFDSSTLINDRMYCFKGSDSGPLVPRILVNRRRQKRYSIEGSYWSVKQISYRIRRGIPVMPDATLKRVIRKAFDVWEKRSPLKFVYKHRGPVDIEILFAKGHHGDGEPFDGRGKVLAHAFFPRYGGDVHFDASEKWSANKHGPGLDLYAVAVHEIGHALGLKHSQEPAAIMAPFYQKYTGSDLYLHRDDLAALQRLYGFGDDGQRKPKWSPPPDLCTRFRLDDITALANGTILAFSGDYFYELKNGIFDLDRPRLISDVWKSVGGSIDAVVTDNDDDTYFFKGVQYWLANQEGKIYRNYPQLIERGLVSMPNDIDAAFIWGYDDQAYFFKNDKYWLYSTQGMPSGWPRPISQLFSNMRHTPQKIDAAVTLPNGDTYLFTGDWYYKMQPNRLAVSRGYPRRTSNVWFGCHKRRRMIENKRLSTSNG